MEMTIEFYIFELVQIPNFSLRKQFLVFETDFLNKDTSIQKQKE